MVMIRSGVAVTGLLAAALVTVGVLTVQASDAPLRSPGGGSGARVPGTAAKRAPHALPGDSGSGSRVVYSLGGHRVWLVAAGGTVLRTFPVTAGDVAPAPGAHRVFARDAATLGGDGTAVEHVVLFATAGGANVGFSAAVHGSPAAADHHRLAAAIRVSRTDAKAMWGRAGVGTVVVVVR